MELNKILKYKILYYLNENIKILSVKNNTNNKLKIKMAISCWITE